LTRVMQIPDCEIGEKLRDLFPEARISENARKDNGDSPLPADHDSESDIILGEFPRWVTQFHRDLQNAGLQYAPPFLRRLFASLLSRRFLILTGLSGSGKTLLAQALAKWLSPVGHEEEPQKEYRIVSVGANWTSKDDFLGYADALSPGRFVSHEPLELLLAASANWESHVNETGSTPLRPYFLILDEMNLSHVERYFSDFLSAMESNEHLELHEPTYLNLQNEQILWTDPPATLRIPPNLMVIGTINVDETTYMFSPKVLDRANVMEFRTDRNAVTAFAHAAYEADPNILSGGGEVFGQDFVLSAQQKLGEELIVPDKKAMADELDLLFSVLADHESEFGFRTAKNIARFSCFYHLLEFGSIDGTEDESVDSSDSASSAPAGGIADTASNLHEATDAQIMQKILPKIHGSVRKIGPILRSLAMLCFERGQQTSSLSSPISGENGKRILPLSTKREELLAQIRSYRSGDVVYSDDPLADLDNIYDQYRSHQNSRLLNSRHQLPLASLTLRQTGTNVEPGVLRIRYPLSLEKTVRMLRKAERDGFAGFTEA
jgi:hypothetical protein